MQITKNRVATLEYTVSSTDGRLLDSSANHGPMYYLHGSGMIIPGLADALEGRSAGETFNVTLPPDRAFGERDPEKIIPVDRKHFDGIDDLRVGMRFQAQLENGYRIVTVSAIEGDKVMIDANHPFAGRTVAFQVRIIEVRVAHEEELAHGHACYGDHSCHQRHCHMHDQPQEAAEHDCPNRK